MHGMNVTNGAPLSGIGHLRQSVRDILTTRRGTRVMRREYGSDIPDLVDRPMNRSTLLAIYAATIGALGRWEPRISVDAVRATSATPGSIELNITGTYLPDGSAVSLDGILVN
ncbi:MAG: phage baseplate protein [Sphingopyxis macrogoltabida]|uniref:Phage baseplate protein n=1 Tax=Sphingopyxis macrogoltabida TaxID=33050 RepID=A0A2W5MMM3_SPHMC|nr:MAG: phage baseplate protein [Sphingopyxis macrogoltabida]